MDEQSRESRLVLLFHGFLGCLGAIFRRLRPIIERHGITPAQFGLLKTLRARGPLTPSEISNAMAVSPANITGIISRLKKLGFVDRRRNVSDRRCLRVALTTEGSTRLDAVIPEWKQAVVECFAGLSDAEQTGLEAALVRLKIDLDVVNPTSYLQEHHS